MKAKTATGVACLMAFCCLPAAQAQIFSCTDANGKTIAADRPIPECSDRPIRVLGANGVPKRVIAAPLTAEQKREKLLHEQKRKQDEAILAEQRQQDRAILLRFQNEHDIASAHKREIGQLNERIAIDREKIAEAEKRLALGPMGPMAPTDAGENRGKPAATRRLANESSERTIRDSRKSIAAYEADIAAVDRKYDKTVQRFRELTAGAASASTDGAGRGAAGSKGRMLRTDAAAN